MAFLLDTGILLRLVSADDPQSAVIHQAIAFLQDRSTPLVVSVQNIAEFWNVSTRPTSARSGHGKSVEDTAECVREIEVMAQVVTESDDTYRLWRRLVVEHQVLGVQVHDARLVAIMLHHRITSLLTLNGADFKRYEPAIRVVTPQALVAADT